MRHGTLAEYVAGCRCDDCRWANARYHKGLVLDMSRGIRRLIDATGTRRRIHALQALGWTLQDIADAAGVSNGKHVHRMTTEPQVRRDSAAKIAAAYDALGHKRGPSIRTRNRAARNGWPLPIMWDDIDDPAATPWTDTAPRGAHVPGHGVVNRDSLTDCAEWGLTVSEAADRLGVSRDAIEHGIARHAPELRARFARNLAAKGAAA